MRDIALKAHHPLLPASVRVSTGDQPSELGVDALTVAGCDQVFRDTPVELAENTLCCGFGGSFSFEYPDVAERLMNRKLGNAEATGTRLIVSDNQGCIMHLRGGLDASGRKIEVRHISELLAERVRERMPPR